MAGSASRNAKQLHSEEKQMKKTWLTTLALCTVLFVASPSMALDADFSGEFRIQGFSHSNTDLTDPESANDSFYDMRVRIKTELKISDNISFTTRFDALERKWGTDTIDTGEENDNLDFDHAYVTVKTPFGALIAGRLIGSQWGSSGIGDSNNAGTDKIMFYVPIENWIFAAYMQKAGELDTGTNISDSDLDKYAALAQYKGENFKAGLLCQHYDYAQIPSMRDFLTFRKYALPVSAAQTAYTKAASADAYYASLVAIGQPAATAAALSGSNLTGTSRLAAAGALALAQGTAAANGVTGSAPVYSDASVTAIDPFVEGSFGSFSYFAEMVYAFGEATREVTDANSTEDVSLLTYHAQGKYDFGPAALRGGYWFLSGDNDITDRELNALGYIERNQDLNIAFILTGTSEFVNAGLQDSLGGGMGNFAAAQGTTSTTDGITALVGAKMIYAGVTVAPMEKLTIDLLYANAKADAPPGLKMGFTTEWSDDIGDEYDLTITWTPYENLEYKVVAAYLDAGDYWKGDAPTKKIEDNLTLYNALTISF